jgi:SAM-dependent methyltransferase
MITVKRGSDIEWQAYGKLDYGASHDVSAGQKEWSLLKRHLEHYGLHHMCSCVELGCGAGRLTAALARDFATVHALDVSADRITQARKVANSNNVSFHQVRDPAVPLSSGTCDLCISTHVFQHISDMDVVEAYLREMRRVLRPGGCLLIHVPVIGAHGMRGNLTEVFRRRSREIAKGIVLALTRRLMRAGLYQLPWKVDHYNVFSFAWLSARLGEIGFEEVELRILPWAGGHSYVFGKNPIKSQAPTTHASSHPD